MKNDYLSEWIDEALQVPSKAATIFEQIEEEELNSKPNASQWSIGELFDHIMVTNSLYFPKYQQIIDGKHKNPFSSKFHYITNFLGKSILQSVDPNNPKKLKTVKKFEPRKNSFTLSQFEDFKTQQDSLIQLITATDRVDHTQTYISSPASSLIVYSLKSANQIILWHELRHIRQATEWLQYLRVNAWLFFKKIRFKQ